MATVLIHLKNGTTDKFDDVEERSAYRVVLAVGKNSRGRLILLGHMYDREDIATVDINCDS